MKGKILLILYFLGMLTLLSAFMIGFLSIVDEPFIFNLSSDKEGAIWLCVLAILGALSLTSISE